MSGLGTRIVAMPLSLLQLHWFMGSKDLVASLGARLFGGNLSIIDGEHYEVRCPAEMLADVHSIV
jgi:hypothetical protein